MVTSHLTLLKSDEYPEFNGKPIHSIYAEYENSRYSSGFYVADILFYKCYYKEYTPGNGTNEKVMHVKDLPKPFARIFGCQTINYTEESNRIFIKDFYIRESDSANGSFIDETLDFSGWSSSGQNRSVGVYRGVKDYGSLDTQEGGWIRKIVDDEIIGKSFDVKTVEFYECGAKMKEGSLDFATKYPYPYCPIRIVDGMIYPDEKLPSWRWLHGLSYRTPDTIPTSYTPKHLRVLDDVLKQHLYLEQVNVEDISEGEENLINVYFKHDRHNVWGDEGLVYCIIKRFNDSLNHAYVRYCKKNGKMYEITNTNKLRETDATFYRINKVVEVINDSVPY